MDPVSTAQIFALQLRQRLLERAKTTTRRADETGRVGAPPGQGTRNLAAFVNQNPGADHEARRALVEQLLANQFGNDVLNQAKFQRIIDKVTDVLESDPELSEQMAKLLKALPEG